MTALGLEDPVLGGEENRGWTASAQGIDGKEEVKDSGWGMKQTTQPLQFLPQNIRQHSVGEYLRQLRKICKKRVSEVILYVVQPAKDYIHKHWCFFCPSILPVFSVLTAPTLSPYTMVIVLQT